MAKPNLLPVLVHARGTGTGMDKKKRSTHPTVAKKTFCAWQICDIDECSSCVPCSHAPAPGSDIPEFGSSSHIHYVPVSLYICTSNVM